MPFLWTDKKKAIKPTDKQKWAYSSAPAHLTLHCARRKVSLDRRSLSLLRSTLGYSFSLFPNMSFPSLEDSSEVMLTLPYTTGLRVASQAAVRTAGWSSPSSGLTVQGQNLSPAACVTLRKLLSPSRPGPVLLRCRGDYKSAHHENDMR